MKPLSFDIQKRTDGTLARAGTLTTAHGTIQTPAFVTVGTKATVKAVSPEQVKDLGAQVVLANTYHLYLEPGEKMIEDAGGLHTYMNWSGPTMTDSGGFQAFSLGAALGRSVGKIAKGEEVVDYGSQKEPSLATIDEDGVTFRSHVDGSEHTFTPERSIEIQHAIGADMIFAFDECTSPHASYEYQKEALDRTHRWAERSLAAHKANTEAAAKQGLLGIVQGGRFEDLRKESAEFIGNMDFDGFGIGGSFDKEDMYTTVGWVNSILPEEKPRHMLGIGEPADFFGGVENGCDLFDCVAPTRIARNGTLYTHDGTINITRSASRQDFTPIEQGCECYTCKNYTKSYIAHLFRAKEMFGSTLTTIHNLYFINKLVADIRQSIVDERFFEFKNEFLARYYNKK